MKRRTHNCKNYVSTASLCARMNIRDKGKDVFIGVPNGIASTAELYDDEGERALGLAPRGRERTLDEEKSARLGDALCRLVGELR